MSEIDYEKDEYAGEKPPEPRSGGLGETLMRTVSSLAGEILAGQQAKQESEAPNRHNQWREDARLKLASLLWTDSAGVRAPIRWTVDCESYYQVLTRVAGLHRPENGEEITGTDLDTYIFLWLATHGRERWFRVDPKYGRALKDNPDWWLETILQWADDEFPLGDPDRLERRAQAEMLRVEVISLSYSSRAEPLPETDAPEEEDTPGN
ncbi:MAG: hypothetical protein EOP87_00195 [Verrucomicrobiaceae bacterium]|nr:MAG: hypothetical protein EOP87_00195 [Verrucomicrobiaceae bacterium]